MTNATRKSEVCLGELTHYGHDVATFGRKMARKLQLAISGLICIQQSECISVSVGFQRVSVFTYSTCVLVVAAVQKHWQSSWVLASETLHGLREWTSRLKRVTIVMPEEVRNE